MDILFSVPAFGFAAYLGYCGRVIDGVSAGLALAAVVVEQAYRPTAEQQYGDEVAYGHYDHTEIDERPYEFDSHKRADEYEYAEYESICKYCLAAVFPAVAEESDIAFAVVVVADYAREGEEEYAYRHDEFACRADVVAERRLGEFYAVGAAVVEAGAEYDQRGAGADDEGVGEDAEGLDEALFDRVADVCGGGCVRGAAFAGFVGEYAAFEAHQYGHSYRSAGRLTEAECAADYDSENLRDGSYVGDDYPQGYAEVGQGHEGHDVGAYFGYALYSAEDDGQGEHAEGYGHQHRRDVEGFSEC